MYIYDHTPLSSSYDEMFQTKVAQKITTHILCSWAEYRSRIATGYGLDGPGIESRWGRDFAHLSRPALGPPQPPVQ
jgi:hypothetical protein